MEVNTTPVLKKISAARIALSALLVFALSSLVIRPDGWHFGRYYHPEMVVQALFGVVVGGVYAARYTRESGADHVVHLCSFTVFFFTYFHVALLTLSGVGIAQWVVVALYLLPGVREHDSERLHPRELVVLIVGLSLVRIAVDYLFEGDRYALFVGRGVVGRVIVAAVVFLLVWVELRTARSSLPKGGGVPTRRQEELSASWWRGIVIGARVGGRVAWRAVRSVVRVGLSSPLLFLVAIIVFIGLPAFVAGGALSRLWKVGLGVVGEFAYTIDLLAERALTATRRPATVHPLEQLSRTAAAVIVSFVLLVLDRVEQEG